MGHRDAERRTADDVDPVPRPVINAVIIVVIDAPVPHQAIPDREDPDPVAVIVRSACPESSGYVVPHEITLAGRYSHKVAVLADPHIVGGIDPRADTVAFIAPSVVAGRGIGGIRCG